MGVEYILYREDTKTYFNLDKGDWYGTNDLAFDPPALLEHLVLWTSHWECGTDAVFILLLRDKILDFVEGAKPSQVKCVTDSFWFDINDNYEYVSTHDRFCTDLDIEKYREALDDAEPGYNPVALFRKSEVSRGKYVVGETKATT